MLYGGMFLLGVVASVIVLIRMLQNTETMPVFRVVPEIMILLFFVVKTVDYYNGYRKHSGIRLKK